MDTNNTETLEKRTKLFQSSNKILNGVICELNNDIDRLEARIESYKITCRQLMAIGDETLWDLKDLIKTTEDSEIAKMTIPPLIARLKEKYEITEQ